jgi:hypothetical protein
MYRVLPYTYLAEGLIGQGEAFPPFLPLVCINAVSVLQCREIICAPIKYVTFNPPSGQTYQE